MMSLVLLISSLGQVGLKITRTGPLPGFMHFSLLGRFSPVFCGRAFSVSGEKNVCVAWECQIWYVIPGALLLKVSEKSGVCGVVRCVVRMGSSAG